MATTSFKAKNLVGTLLQIPIFITATLAVLRLTAGFMLTFTDYNFLEPPKFIGFGNYAIFKDEVVRIAFSNTAVLFGISIALVFLLGVLPAVFIARLKRWVGVVFSVLYALVSLSAYTAAYGYFFSSDSYGFLNSLFLHYGLLSEPVNWVSDKPLLPAVIILTVSVIGPAFIITYIATLFKRGIFGSAAGLCAAAFLMIEAENNLVVFFGYPSVDYKATCLPSVIKDYAMVRYEIGTAATLALVGFAMLAGFCLLVCGVAVALHFGIKKRRETPSSGRAPAFVFMAVSAVFIVVAAIPVFIHLQNALKPIEELFTFPPSVVALRPTLKNFSDWFKLCSNVWPFEKRQMLLYNVKSIRNVFMFALRVILPSACGLALLKNDKRRLLLSLPLLLLASFVTSGQFKLSANSNILVFFSSAACILLFAFGFLTVRLMQRGGKWGILVGIPTLLLGAAATAVNFSNFSTLSDPVGKSWFLFNKIITSAGVARIGISAASDVLILGVTLFVTVVPMVFLLLLCLITRKKRAAADKPVVCGEDNIA